MSILFEIRDSIGLVTLDRPEALNAMDAAMATAMNAQLLEWADDPAVESVLVRGAGKAFCAGGDVRAVWRMRQDALQFFDPEYDLVRTIRAYPKPYTALMDGITMGGGVGLSIYARRRIATPNTVWAMPECAIGFYPDIGATWFLPRLPDEVGTYLALTGARLTAPDLLGLGIATGFTTKPEELLRNLPDVIPDGAPSGPSRNLAAENPRSSLGFGRDDGGKKPAVNRCFAFETVEEIMGALHRDSSAWAAETLAALSRMSPTSLKVTLRALRLGRILSFGQAMTMERGLTRRFLHEPDLYEGIRAALIDRDGAPRWNPADLSSVDDAFVSGFFTGCK